MTTTETIRTNGQRPVEGIPLAGARAQSVARRRQVPLVVLGVLLVVGGALAFADASLHLGGREQVLELSQPLSAGQVVQPSDLETVRVSTGSGLQVVSASQEASVVGRPASVPLVAGALLTSGEIGATAPVAAGSDVVAVGLKSGQYPPDLSAGDRVQVVPVVTSSATGAEGSGTGHSSLGSPISATVLAVNVGSAASDSPTVFSLQVSKGDADEVAALASANEATLIQMGSGAG